jgi:Ser/Thr protein kinase RdoA (MazF antagonist)
MIDRAFRAVESSRTVTDIALRIAKEYDLGTLLRAEPLPGGGPEVIRLVAAAGNFVVKPVSRPFELELYSTVEQRLNAGGIRQARLLRTVTGSAVSRSGHAVQELLPGAITMTPTKAQCHAVFAHLGRYDTALADIAVPPEIDATNTVFTRVVDPGFLRSRLPALFRQFAPDHLDIAPVEAALDRLAASAAALIRAPRQLLHGDIGPDNVLLDGDSVVSVIDFTPFHKPVPFGLSTALYWYFVRRKPAPDLAGIRAALASYGWARSNTEVAAGLLLEAVRRLATPLALAEETGRSGSVPEIQRRYAALVWVVSNLDAVAG